MSFAHPHGLPSLEWSYDDAKALMQALVRDVFNGQPVPFHITFEIHRDDESQPSRLRTRHFLITSERGRVDLEPLYLTYLGTFGMLAVFYDFGRATR